MRITSRDRWFPAGTERASGYGDRPEVGEVVAYDRRAWTVTHVKVRDFEEDDLPRLALYKPDKHDRFRPYSVSLRRLHGAKHDRENSRQEIGLRVRAFSYGGFDRYDEGRVPLCSCCQHPWPCLMVDAKKAAAASAEVLDERMARTGPGICYACGEVITQRQGSVTYPEGNVDLPGYPAPRFHTRQTCFGGRWSYEKRRAAMYPDVPSLIEAEQAQRQEGLL